MRQSQNKFRSLVGDFYACRAEAEDSTVALSLCGRGVRVCEGEGVCVCVCVCRRSEGACVCRERRVTTSICVEFDLLLTLSYFTEIQSFIWIPS